MSSYGKRVFDAVERRNPGEVEFLQAVKEVIDSLDPVLGARPSTRRTASLNASVSLSVRFSSGFRGLTMPAACR